MREVPLINIPSMVITTSNTNVIPPKLRLSESRNSSAAVMVPQSVSSSLMAYAKNSTMHMETIDFISDDTAFANSPSERRRRLWLTSRLYAEAMAGVKTSTLSDR